MSENLVSIIVPAYNAERYLAVALESALAQTHANLEVIVVDDGSTDTSLSIARKIAERDRRVRVYSQANAGVGAARNRAIAEAKGDFIAPLDADDFWYPEKLARQIEALESRGPEWALAYCWSTTVDEEGHAIEPLPHWPVEGDILEALIYRNIIGNASVPLFRTEALRKVGGYLTREEQGAAQGCEDWDITLRIAAKYKAVGVPKYLSAYRQIAGTMTSDFCGMSKSYAYVMSRLRREHPELPALLFRWSSGHFHMYLLNISYGAGNYRACYGLILRLLRADATMILCPTIYRIAIVSTLRLLFGSHLLVRTHHEQPEENALPVFWFPARLVEAYRWRQIRRPKEKS